MMENGFIIVALAFLGACFGSFANAAIWRLKVKKSIVNDRSECVHCHHKLSAFDLVPILSWVMLRGKCRYCHKNIDDSPLVELAVLAYFVGSFLIWPTALDSLSAWADFGLWLSYGVGLAILFVYDLKWFLLPDKVVRPLVVLASLGFINRGLWYHWSIPQFVTEFVLGLLSLSGLYGLLYVISRGKWVGLGDIKLGIFIGLALGWQLTLICLVVANLIGCLYVIPGLISGALKRDSRIPFGPLLILGFVIAGLWGQTIINWYLSNLGL